MTDVMPGSRLEKMVIGLLRHYSFDAANRPLMAVLSHWLNGYPSEWVLNAVIEALYQGRYKTISVEQILIVWQRRGKPIPHFSHEFERIVCDRILEVPNVTAATSPSSQPGTKPLKLDNDRDISLPGGNSATGNDHTAPSTMAGTHATNATKNSLGVVSTVLNQPGEATDSIPTGNGSVAQTPSLPSAQSISSSTPDTSLSSSSLRQQFQERSRHHHPIDKFQPAKLSAEAHTKLKAIAQSRISPHSSPP